MSLKQQLLDNNYLVIDNFISQEKAKELFGKFAMYLRANLMYDEEADEDAKQCALIVCNEVLGYMGADRGYAFWTEVKQEVENL